MQRLFAWPRAWFASSRRRHGGRVVVAPARPEVEPLEDRLAPARILVHTLADGPSLPIPPSHVAPNLRSAIDNSAAGDEIDLDSGVYTLSGELVVTHNLLIRNGAGGVSVINARQSGRVFEIGAGASVTLSGLTLTGGRDINQGAGILNLGTLTISNSTITGNATFGGGGILNVGTLAISDSTIAGNTAYGSGGGLFNVGTLTVTNSTITGNTAASGSGGGILNAGTALLVNDTIARNTAGTGGGLALASPATQTRVWNTLVALNTAAADPDILGSFVSLGHNLIGNTAGATGFSTAKQDLLNVSAASIGLGQLASNGGPTQTMRLLPGSVAIDRGDDGVLTSPLTHLTTDQRGKPRRSGAHVDIGAYESP